MSTDPGSPRNFDEDEGYDSGQPPKALGQSFKSWKTWLSFGLALLILVFVFRGLKIDFHDAWRQMTHANKGYLLIGFACYYGSLFIRGLRWRFMLGQAGMSEKTGHRLPGAVGMFEIILLSWFANSVLPAKLGDAYRGYLIKQRSNCSFGISFGTVLAERLIDLVVLVSVLLVSGMMVFGTHAPGKTEQAFLLGGGVVLLGVIGVAALWVLRDHIERFLPTKAVRHYRRVQNGLFDVLRKPWQSVAVSVVLWLLEGLRVFAVARSLGPHISFPEATMVSLISALVSVIPFTPAGLGFVEGFMVTALKQIGVRASTAGAIMLLDRVITYVSLIIIGIPLYLLAFRRDLTTGRDESTLPTRAE